jgi:Pyruvate/2-oxoacid:ferredoxin oxidoreductase gamma subunit
VNNVVMLGALSAFLGLPQKVWLEVIAERVPASYVSVNQEAFGAGRQYMAARLEERAYAR